ncbi:MAG TPA: DUF983 domain-containing protein [Dehalococcoidia bacterium]|nr:DUF983 domain-containing protein [Dehalococcoidia bacterium]
MKVKHEVRLGAMLAGRCPRCGRGPIFHPLLSTKALSMYRACPVCGLDYEPEAGYFIGAMYASYAFGVAVVVPVALALVLLFDASIALTLGIALALTLVLAPFEYRAARVLWLHIDQAVAPR